RLLALVMPTTEACATVPADRVDLVDEDDAGCVSLPLLEQVPHTGCADAHEHFDEVRPGHREEGAARLTGDGTGKQRLSCPGRADEERAFRDPATQAREALRVFKEFDDLLKLVLCLVGAGHISERHLRRVGSEELRLRLSKLECLRATRLHLADDEDPEGDDQDPGKEAHDDSPPFTVGPPRVDPDASGL